jgi:uncharacterized protein with PIN domain
MSTESRGAQPEKCPCCGVEASPVDEESAARACDEFYHPGQITCQNCGATWWEDDTGLCYEPAWRVTR